MGRGWSGGPAPSSVKGQPPTKTVVSQKKLLRNSSGIQGNWGTLPGLLDDSVPVFLIHDLVAFLETQEIS